MKLWERLKARINSMLTPPSLSETIAHEMERAQVELQQARHVIVTHEFLEHMAKARIAALEAWNHRGDAE